MKTLILILISTLSAISQTNFLTNKIISIDDKIYSTINSNIEDGYFTLSIYENSSKVDYIFPEKIFDLNMDRNAKWEIKDNNLYFINRIRYFHNFVGIDVSMINLSNLIPKDTDVSNAAAAIRSSQKAEKVGFIRDLHERGFNKDQLENLYFDFVFSDNKILFASYFEESFCIYEILEGEEKSTLCGCEKLILKAPFRLLTKNDNLFLVDSNSVTYDVKKVQSEIVLERNNNNLLQDFLLSSIMNESIKEKIGNSLTNALMIYK